MILSRTETIEKEVIFDSALEKARDDIEKLFSDRPVLEKLEERYIKLILGEVSQSKDEAAHVLGISRRTLYRKERSYGLVSAELPEPDELSLEAADETLN